MPKSTKTKVEIKPVAWSGTTVLKYQGFVTVTRPDGTEKVMTGEPMGTEEAALSSLKYEMMQRQQDVNAAMSAIKLM